MTFDFASLYFNFYLRVSRSGPQIGKIIVQENPESALIANSSFRVSDGDVVIFNLHVKEKYRNIGLGSMIVGIIQQFARVTDKRILITPDEDSVEFWKKQGFELYKDEFYVWRAE